MKHETGTRQPNRRVEHTRLAELGRGRTCCRCSDRCPLHQHNLPWPTKDPDSFAPASLCVATCVGSGSDRLRRVLAPDAAGTRIRGTFDCDGLRRTWARSLGERGEQPRSRTRPPRAVGASEQRGLAWTRRGRPGRCDGGSDSLRDCVVAAPVDCGEDGRRRLAGVPRGVPVGAGFYRTPRPRASRVPRVALARGRVVFKREGAERWPADPGRWRSVC